MIIKDWQDLSAYEPLLECSGAQWAWEFLRRNPLYQQEWKVFDAVWRSLEAAYGKAPNRNFPAWKEDPRAWILASDENGSDCRVDQDKVLIECAMGARWGFYKFPPDPLKDGVIENNLLIWREQAMADIVLQKSTPEHLMTPNNAVIVFELDMPLKHQIERAKKALLMEQRVRLRQQGMVMKSIQAISDQLVLQIRYLDGLAAGASDKQMDFMQADTRTKAIEHRDKGYLGLLQLPA